ncbi:MAG: DUF6382 domain-containing protein [Coprococcus sp.]
MEMSCRTDGINSYLVIDDIDISGESYEINMINNNDIEGLLPFEFRSLNETGMIYYRINGCAGINQLVSADGLETDYIERLISSVISLISDLNMYMLSPDNLIIDINNVYYDNINKLFRFAYLPDYNVDIRKQIKALVEEGIKLTNHRNHKAVDYIYGIYDIVIKPNYDIKEIENYINADKGRCNEEQCNVNSAPDIPDRRGLVDELFSNEPDIVQINVNDFSDAMNENSRIPEVVSQKNNENPQNIYKKICIISIVITGIAGLLIAFRQFRNTGHIEYVKPLMGVLILMAVECFVYLQISKRDADAADLPEKGKDNLFKRDKTVHESVVMGKPRLETVKEVELSENYDGTSILNIGEDTSVLLTASEYVPVSGREQKMAAAYRLIPCNQSTAGPIDIYSDPVVVGRDGGRVNYVIDNKMISRIHAKIYIDNNHLIIEDMSSTNGTYINSCILEAKHPVMAGKGDIISFGNVSFCVDT